MSDRSKQLGLMPGDELEVIVPFHAISGKDYKKGMILELIKLTKEASFLGSKGEGVNWLVKCPYFESVWSSIWWALENGWLRKNNNAIDKLGDL